MADLIERSAAIQALDRFSLGETDAVKLSIRMGDYLKRMPAVDVVPVVHGHWIELGNKNSDGTHNICCSACRDFKTRSRGHARSYYTKAKYKFCGGCGAKMDGKDKTDGRRTD